MIAFIIFLFVLVAILFALVFRAIRKINDLQLQVIELQKVFLRICGMLEAKPSRIFIKKRMRWESKNPSGTTAGSSA